MSASTNLAIRPFRNERLPWLMAGLLLVIGLVLSLLHASFLTRLLSGDEAKTVVAVRENEAAIRDLEDRLAKEPPAKVDGTELARLRAFKDLVDRRVFPWRRFLSDLEQNLSDDVRLVRISPAPAKNGRGMVVSHGGEARTKDAVFSFAESLGGVSGFSNALLRSISEEENGVKFDVDVVFDPTIAGGRAVATAPVTGGLQ